MKGKIKEGGDREHEKNFYSLLFSFFGGNGASRVCMSNAKWGKG